MRIGRKLQYGMLFAIYLSRSGRSTIDVISKNLRVPKSFLEQIAREMRIAGILKSIRGPNGGYELIEGTTVGGVFAALNEITLLSPQEMTCYKRGEIEHRALGAMVRDMAFALSPVTGRKIKDVVMELVDMEKYALDRNSPSLRSN